MRKNRNRILANIFAACLLNAGAAWAACDRESAPEIFGVADLWEDPGHANRGHARFTKACDELIVCYGSVSSPKFSCDRAYAQSLKKVCLETFDFHPGTLVRCNKVTDIAIELVEEKAGSVYRKGQRQASANQRAEARRKRAEERKSRAAERRQRRLELRRKSQAQSSTIGSSVED